MQVRNYRNYDRQPAYRNNHARGHDGAMAATGLGLLSIALGLAEVLVPEKLDRLLGTGNGENAGILRVLGARELCHGVDLLMHRDPGPGLKARLAGDALDGILLGLAASRSKNPGGVAAAAAMVAPVVLADLLYASES